MNARLGFSIAAHLDPEVLIIDEVLAVGDFAFQQRAFGRIQEMVKQDVTTILVSHQLERIASLCARAVLLRRGEVAHAGSASETIGAYVNGVNEEAQGARTDSPLLIRTARSSPTDRSSPAAASRSAWTATSSTRLGSTTHPASASGCDRCRTERCSSPPRRCVRASRSAGWRVSRSTSRSSSIPRRASTPLKPSCSIGSASSSSPMGRG